MIRRENVLKAKKKEEKRLRRRARRKAKGVGKHALRPRAPGFTKALKREIRARDGNRCVICGTEEALRIHHINENGNDHRWENLITVCVDCHLRIHQNGLKIPLSELERIQ